MATAPVRFVIHIRVDALAAQPMPVQLRLDFAEILREHGGTGRVDPMTMDMQRLTPQGFVSIPYQFSPEPQARLDPHLPPSPLWSSGAPTGWPAAEAPADLRTVGTLTWLTTGDPSGREELRLIVEEPRQGRVVQTPFQFHALRFFDDDLRAHPPRHRTRMLIRPLHLLDGRLQILEGDQPVTEYFADHGDRPFLYPLRTPSGVPTTSYGMPHDPTESHAHHKSVWIAHAAVDEWNFWGLDNGAIRHRGFPLLEEGPLFARVVQRTRWVAEGVERLRDVREWTFWRADGKVRAVDLVLTVQAPDERAITVGQTTFGWLAFRVDPRLSVFDGGGELRNSRDQRNEMQAFRQPAEWMDLSGPIGPDRWAGIALLDHPGNPDHPPLWHCRNDGWAGAAATGRGPLQLDAGETRTWRYRFLVHDGDVEEAGVAESYAAYSACPAPTICKVERIHSES